MNLSSLINIIPLLLSEGGIKNLLKDGTIIKPIMTLFGIPEESADNLISLVTRLLQGELDLKQLLPIILPVLTNFLQTAKNNAPETTSEAFESFVKLEPVENFVGDEIYSSLSDYFDNETAS